MKRVFIAGLVSTVLVSLPSDAAAQFRRGFMADTVEVTLYPHEPPAALLPAGAVDVDVRNASPASARIVERLRDTLKRQIADNDARLRIVDRAGDVTVVATITDWSETRRNSTKYDSEKRQIGTREVVDKDGKKRTEPVYEYGRNKPSVVISARAGLRLEVKRRAGGLSITDQSAQHSIQEEHFVESGPPTRDQIEDALIDNVVKKGAGRITPGRGSVKVLLARSDDVERFNALAQQRNWQEWLTVLEKLTPHRDRKRDAYRLHNLAVAHEAMAYEASTVEDWNARLNSATRLIAQASAQNSGEKYITESSDRIASSLASYRVLAELYAAAGATPATGASAGGRPVPARLPGTITTSTPVTTMTNQDVIELKQGGLDDTNLIAAVRDAKSVKFDLSAEGLKGLLAAKVSNGVITAMRSRATK